MLECLWYRLMSHSWGDRRRHIQRREDCWRRIHMTAASNWSLAQSQKWRCPPLLHTLIRSWLGWGLCFASSLPHLAPTALAVEPLPLHRPAMAEPPPFSLTLDAAMPCQHDPASSLREPCTHACHKLGWGHNVSKFSPGAIVAAASAVISVNGCLFVKAQSWLDLSLVKKGAHVHIFIDPLQWSVCLSATIMGDTSVRVWATHLADQAGYLAIRANDKAGRGIVQVDVIGRQLVPVLSRECGRLRDAHMPSLARAGSAVLRLHRKIVRRQ